MQEQSPYPRASRQHSLESSIFSVRDVAFGGEAIPVIAGPCSVESRTQIVETAMAVKEAGAVALRGGAFKPRTSPYSFQGHGEKALEWLMEAKQQTGLPVVTELMDASALARVCEVADVLQIGSRNMQNFTLLQAVSRTRKTVLLKRGMSNTLEELLLAAEYLLVGEVEQVLLCERGIRTFAQETRNTFDINAIPALKQHTHLPVIADPSHGTGKSEYVGAIAQAAIAAGADGLLLEVHPDPANARSDGRQSLTPEAFQKLIRRLQRVAQAVDRRILPVSMEAAPFGGA